MDELLWEGRLKSSEPVAIYKMPTKGSRCIVLQARTKAGIIADRWVMEHEPGVFRLESHHSKFDMGSQQQITIVNHPSEGIGSRLIALALKEVCQRGGRQVHLQSIENKRWARHLVEKLGATRTDENPTLVDVVWEKDQLTLDRRQAWHQFLE